MTDDERIKLNEERRELSYFIGDIYRAIGIIEEMENDSRDKIIDILTQKLSELRGRVDEISELLFGK